MFNIPVPQEHGDEDDSDDGPDDNDNADHLVGDFQTADGRAYRNHIVATHFTWMTNEVTHTGIDAAATCIALPCREGNQINLPVTAFIGA